MAYCDYCDCPNCRNGASWLVHAMTVDGKWICDVCYDYEVCQKFEERKGKGPCETKNCAHRPKLVTEWSK